MSETNNTKLSRRSFLKIAGLAGAAVQAGALVAGGVAAGKDTNTYTGWESFNPATQFFNRKPFEFAGPAHTPVGEVGRPGHLTDYVFGRVATFSKALSEHQGWALGDPIEDLGFPPPLTEFYKNYPERLEWDYKTFTETIPTNAEDKKIFGNYFLLADIYSSGFETHGACFPTPNEPPEISDFKYKVRGMKEPAPLREPVPFKSPELAAEFIKEIAHRYGATLVGITKAKLDFFYSEGWAGCPPEYDYSKLPEHW